MLPCPNFRNFSARFPILCSLWLLLLHTDTLHGSSDGAQRNLATETRRADLCELIADVI